MLHGSGCCCLAKQHLTSWVNAEMQQKTETPITLETLLTRNSNSLNLLGTSWLRPLYCYIVTHCDIASYGNFWNCCFLLSSLDLCPETGFSFSLWVCTWTQNWSHIGIVSHGVVLWWTGDLCRVCTPLTLQQLGWASAFPGPWAGQSWHRKWMDGSQWILNRALFTSVSKQQQKKKIHITYFVYFIWFLNFTYVFSLSHWLQLHAQLSRAKDRVWPGRLTRPRPFPLYMHKRRIELLTKVYLTPHYCGPSEKSFKIFYHFQLSLWEII